MAPVRPPPALERAEPSRSGTGWPSPLPAFLEAAGRVAARAAERGDLPAARRALGEALGALERDAAAPVAALGCA